MSYRVGDYLDSGDCVSDDVVLARYVADVGCELGDEVEVVELSC
jgi:hypothetical protein